MLNCKTTLNVLSSQFNYFRLFTIMNLKLLGSDLIQLFFFLMQATFENISIAFFIIILLYYV